MAVPTLASVKKLTEDNFIMVFSKSYCPYCKRAKALLQEVAANKQTKIIELDQSEHTSEYQNILSGITGKRTVPLIFIGGKFVGGSDDIYKLHNEGKLRPLVGPGPDAKR